MKIHQKEKTEEPQSKQCRYCKMEIDKEAKVCPYCRKRQGGRGKWIVLVVAVVVILFAAAGNNSEEQQELVSQATTERTEEEMGMTLESPVAEETQPTPMPTPSMERYDSGMYLVGKDIPAGEYAVFATRSLGYMEVTTDSSGNFDSILCNQNFRYNTIVTLEEGRYFSMTGAYAVPFEQADIDTSGNGMFKIGVNLPADEYKIVVDEDTRAGMGYIEVATDSRHEYTSIRTNDNIESSAYISVNEGEYLTLERCHIEQ